MRTSIKLIAATLGLAFMLGSAHADDQSVDSANRALHRSIAMQGDQALVAIHMSAADLISQSIRKQMAVSLPIFSVSDQTPQAYPEVSATELASAARDY